MAKKADAGLAAQIIAIYQELKRPVADWELVDRLGVDANLTNPVFSTTRVLWKKGITVRAPEKVPGRLVNNKRMSVEAFNLPEYVPGGIPFAAAVDALYETKVDIVAALLGRCMENWLSTRISRKKLVINDKLITAEDFGVTNAAMTKSANEILRYLRREHGTDLQLVINGLDSITTFAEILQAHDAAAAETKPE